MIPGGQNAAAVIRPSVLLRLHPAVRLGALLLGIATSFAVHGFILLVIAGLLLLLLSGTGWGWRALAAAVRPWLPAVALILVVHVLTHTETAPLGHPSWQGLAAGCLALVRLGCTLALLGLYQRVSSLDDLVQGIGWWLAPLRRIGVPVDDLGLVLAVALGTVPVAMAEGRRIETALRLRRSGPRRLEKEVRPRRSNPLERLMDKIRLLVPLLESLGRRADNLTLTLRSRRPGAGAEATGPPLGQTFGLGFWLVALAGWLWWRGGAP